MTPPDARNSPIFRSANTPGFAPLLESLSITLLVTTYQAGKLMAVRGRNARVSTLLRSFERPMGLALSPGRFALGTRNQVWIFQNAPDIAAQLESPGHDACYLPRLAYFTGDIRGHELAWAGAELWIVNTFFSCLCVPDAAHSFEPRWHPPFLSRCAPGDACHLNGLAVVDERPRYATALGESSEPQGWRENKARGGILLDIDQDSVICRNLSMPHSPRWHDGKLWLLESGAGQLAAIDPKRGHKTTVAQLPGFVRGLAFLGPFAFVGLSRIRESAMLSGLPIAASGTELQCGIWVVDLRTGAVAEYMQFQAGVEEIFAVEILHGARFPEIMGPQQDAAQSAFVIPSVPPPGDRTNQRRQRKKSRRGPQ
jgi:uncharacterized protein (TIGR03032 family)